MYVLEGEAAQQFVQGLQKYSGDEKDDEQEDATDAATSEFFERTSGGDHISDYAREARRNTQDDDQTQNGLIVLDVNGKIKRSDNGANMIYVDTGSGLELFHDGLVHKGKMTPEGFRYL